MENKSHEASLTEYQVINAWRNNASNIDFILTSFTMPLSLVIFSTYLTSFGCPSLFIRISFGIMSCGLLVFWRCYAHYIDKKIFKLYPTICALEEELKIDFTKEYLKSEFYSNKNYSPSIRISPWLVTYEMLDFKQRFFSRGHGWFNIIFLFLFLSELAIYIFR